MNGVDEGTDPIGVSVDDATRLSGIGRTKLFELIESGQLRSVKVGRRRIVSVASIRDLIDGGPDDTAA